MAGSSRTRGQKGVIGKHGAAGRAILHCVMPLLTINGTSLYHEDTGGAGAPVVFSQGVPWSSRVFAPQVAALRSRFRCVSYDLRGQGRSSSGRREDAQAGLDVLADDAAALIERLGLGPCHFVGLCTGGRVGLRLAARRPELVRSLVLLDTGVEPEPQARARRYGRLARAARWLGPWAVAPQLMPVLFGRSFLSDPARADEREEWRERLRSQGRSTWLAAQAALGWPGAQAELAAVRTPTLVLVGEEDVATLPAAAERLQAAIAGARLLRIPRAGHTAPIENPAAVSTALAGFLEGLLAQAA